jgi:hypothetical protein
MSESKKYFINSHKAISETIDGETIIINLETGSYYSMNPAGTALWNAIVKAASIPVGEPAIAGFMQNLLDEGLVLESDSSSDEIVEDVSMFLDPRIEKYEDMQEMLLADPIHDVETAGWPNLKKE